MSDARPQLSRCKRPLGIQNLREIREGGYCTADKSGMAVGLVESGKHSFLSRPHRFGKSLLVDTLKELFEGHRALFSRLAAELVATPSGPPVQLLRMRGRRRPRDARAAP